MMDGVFWDVTPCGSCNKGWNLSSHVTAIRLVTAMKSMELGDHKQLWIVDSGLRQKKISV
jgi:hypothetical protein